MEDLAINANGAISVDDTAHNNTLKSSFCYKIFKWVIMWFNSYNYVKNFLLWFKSLVWYASCFSPKSATCNMDSTSKDPVGLYMSLVLVYCIFCQICRTLISQNDTYLMVFSANLKLYYIPRKQIPRGRQPKGWSLMAYDWFILAGFNLNDRFSPPENLR